MNAAHLVAAMSVVACVDVPHPFGRHARPRVGATRASAREVVDAATGARGGTTLDWSRQRSATPRVLHHEPEAQFVVRGQLRAEAHGAAVTIATDIPGSLEDFVAAERVTRGWVFVTSSGAAFASTTFTGRLRPLGYVNACPGTRTVRWASPPGRFVTCVGAHVAWSDGEALHVLDDGGAIARDTDAPQASHEAPWPSIVAALDAAAVSHFVAAPYPPAPDRPTVAPLQH